MTYFDHAATTPMRPGALAAWEEVAKVCGNPSSLHADGRAARKVVEESREAIASYLGCATHDVLFTSGGTESDNMAVVGIARAMREGDSARTEVLISPIEHHAVLEAAQSLVKEGFSVSYMPMGPDGAVDAEVTVDYIGGHQARLAVVSLMGVNNETGVIQPVCEVGQACRSVGIPFHSDMVQAGGLWPWFMNTETSNDCIRTLNEYSAHGESSVAEDPSASEQFSAALPYLDHFDALTFSAHKLGGPIGIGALILRRGTPMSPTTFGGGQEFRLRSGTIPTPLVASFATAVREVEASLPDEMARLEFFDTQVETLLTSVGARIVGVDSPRTTTTTYALFPECEAESLLMMLDQTGICVSIGSACTAGVAQPSHVLAAMGYDEIAARSGLRFSLGWTTTQEDINRLTEVLPIVFKQVSRAPTPTGNQSWPA